MYVCMCQRFGDQTFTIENRFNPYFEDVVHLPVHGRALAPMDQKQHLPSLYTQMLFERMSRLLASNSAITFPPKLSYAENSHFYQGNQSSNVG